MLAPALAAYETEKLTGVMAGNEDFQAVVRQRVPHGHTFKGYPVLVNHRSPERVLELLKAEAVPADILGTRGDHTRFGLRVKVYAYPEEVCAVWVMLAVQYRAS